jgi:hypothetical protein
VTVSVEPTLLGPAPLSVIGIRFISGTEWAPVVMVHAYTGPEVAAGWITMICTAAADGPADVPAIAQLNARPATPTGVSVIVGGAWTDAGPALAGIAMPEAVMAGICAVLPVLWLLAVVRPLGLGLGLGLARPLALLWPERARPETVMSVDCAVPAPVTWVNAGRVVLAGGSCTGRVVSVTVVAVPTMPVAGALSTASTVTGGMLAVEPVRLHE